METTSTARPVKSAIHSHVLAENEERAAVFDICACPLIFQPDWQ